MFRCRITVQRISGRFGDIFGRRGCD
uniref:Uncharacterized protein n=1 Tax=Anguilla anguilla TaxID=7936 RepID=A0A0E9RMF5_ANGAN